MLTKFDNSNDDARALIKAISSEDQNLDEPGSRQKMLALARSLVSSLESPEESISRLTVEGPPRLFAIRASLDLKIFDTLAEDDGRPKSVTELAAPCDASPKLVRRFVGALCAFGIVDQVGDDEYAQNQMSKHLTYPTFRGGIRFSCDLIVPTFHQTPEFLEKQKYQNPEDTSNLPFHYSHDGQDKWTWLKQHPQVMEAFLDYLNGVNLYMPGFADIYPVQERLADGLVLGDGATSAFVDVGGGNGGLLVEFQRKTQWPGRLVLQDQEPVITLTKSQSYASTIEPTVHDFFTPQPLVGARAFYMRYILHDWPDEACRRILLALKGAMTPGYSKILIHDCVVADRNPSWYHTALDMIMMVCYGGQERTESEWRGLIDSVGLKIAGIWSKGDSNLSVIEVVV